MTANAEIVLEEHPNSLIVPEAAIIYDAEPRSRSSTCRAPGRGSGRRSVAVKLGVGSGTRTQVLEGLKRRRPGHLPR